MSFAAAVSGSLSKRDAHESIAATHEIVINEIKRLDPDVLVEKTGYFNHSFVPDLNLRWSRAQTFSARNVFLRFSVRDRAFGRDLDLLADRSAMFLGLVDGEPEHGSPEWARVVRRPLNGTLITPAGSVDQLDEAIQDDQRTAIATTGLVREGHGFISSKRARELGRHQIEALRAIDEVALSERFASSRISETLSEFQRVLTEPGFVDFEQSLHSLWIRHGGDPSRFPARVPWNPQSLPEESLRRILLDLLESERSVDESVWRRVASHITAEEIGRLLGVPVRGAHMDSLVTALLDEWTAQWVWADDVGAVPFEEKFSWITDGRLLGLSAGDLTVYFADDGRHFKDKPRDLEFPTLREAEDLLADPDVVGVALLTSQDEVEYRRRLGRQSVRDRVSEILAAPHAAAYRVQALTVAVPGSDWNAEVNFSRRMIDINERPTPLKTLARLAYRYFSRAPRERQAGLEYFLAHGTNRASALR